MHRQSSTVSTALAGLLCLVMIGTSAAQTLTFTNTPSLRPDGNPRPYAAGGTGLPKAKTTTLNNRFVSRSTDGAQSWTASLVYHDPRPVNLGRRLAVDPVTGKLY